MISEITNENPDIFLERELEIRKKNKLPPYQRFISLILTGENEKKLEKEAFNFKNFIENALFREDFKDFEIPENIYLTSLNYDTGVKSTPGEKKSIIEALKLKDINNLDNKNLVTIGSSDKTIRFRQFY